MTPPEVSLTAAAFLATLQMPAKWIEKKLTNAEDRALVLSMYHELQATGRVEATLPEDDRTVRDLHAKEVAEPRAVKQAAARAERLAKSAPVKKADVAVPVPAAAPKSAPAQRRRTRSATDARTPATGRNRGGEQADCKTCCPTRAGCERLGERPFLKESDDLEAAPSIGPRSAQWFGDIGIFTVGDFLAADPVSHGRGARAPTASALKRCSPWQQQAHLVIDVPGLRGTHAQLLTGAGYHDAAAVAAAERSRPLRRRAALCDLAGRAAHPAPGPRRRTLRRSGAGSRLHPLASRRSASTGLTPRQGLSSPSWGCLPVVPRLRA